MAFRGDNIVVSYLLCLSGVGPYPGRIGDKITKLITWYSRLLHIGLYLAIICLNLKHLMDYNFNGTISIYVLIVITVLLSHLLTTHSFQIQKREAQMKKCYIVLKEVHEQLRDTCKIDVESKHIHYYVTVYILLEFVMCIMYTDFVSNCRQTDFLRYAATVHFSQQYIQMLITIQFIYFIRHIHEGLVMINKSLKNPYRIIVNATKDTNANIQLYTAMHVRSKAFVSASDHEAANTIRKIALSYSKLCQLIYLINDKDGSCLLWTSVYMTTNVIMSMYNLLLEITNVADEQTTLLLPTLWLILTTTRLVLLTEQCHRIHEQMGNIRHYLARLKCSFGERVLTVANELDLFQRLMMLKRPTFSPHDMFTLTRTFCTKVLGAVITILVLIVTYGKEVNG